MDKQQYDELAVAIALVLDREAYLKQQLEEKAGEILEEQKRLLQLRKALIGTSANPDGLIQFFGPVLHEQDGTKKFANDALYIVEGTDVEYDEQALVAHLAKQGRYGYLSIKRKPTESMLRSTLDNEPDLPAMITKGPKVHGVSSVNLAKGFEIPPDCQFDEKAIQAQIERAVAEQRKIEQKAAADEMAVRIVELNAHLNEEPHPENTRLELLKQQVLAGDPDPDPNGKVGPMTEKPPTNDEEDLPF